MWPSPIKVCPTETAQLAPYVHTKVALSKDRPLRYDGRTYENITAVMLPQPQGL